MKGKSTAAFGMALRGWNAGFSLGVFQFVKSAKWKVGEESAFRALGELHENTGQGGPVEWHKMGEGWSWSRKKGSDEDHAEAAREGWREIAARIADQRHQMYVLDEFTYPLHWGWVDVDEVVSTLTAREGRQHVIITGRNAPAALVDAADLVLETSKIKHPMDDGQKGQRGIEW
jgi:cob(I)alamin adenosyltransferase